MAGGDRSGGARRLLRRGAHAALLIGMLLGLTQVVGPDARHRAGASTTDPPGNITPNPPFFQDCSSAAYDGSSVCVNAAVQAIDNARSQEGVGPIGLPSNWNSLTPAEQTFVVTNLERTARGLPAMTGMATRLDQAAQQATAQGQDPTVPSDFPAGRWTSNWAGNAGNPLEVDYFWMYYDGPGTNNVGCQQAGQAGCWIHRHNILVALTCQPCVNGSGFSPTGFGGGTSWGELLSDTSSTPAMDFWWSQVTGYLPWPSEAGSTGGAPAPTPYNSPAVISRPPTSPPPAPAPVPVLVPPASPPSSAPAASGATAWAASPLATPAAGPVPRQDGPPHGLKTPPVAGRHLAARLREYSGCNPPRPTIHTTSARRGGGAKRWATGRRHAVGRRAPCGTTTKARRAPVRATVMVKGGWAPGTSRLEPGVRPSGLSA